jgi:hypothetical protein
MTMKDLSLAIGCGVLLLSVGCTQRSVSAPTELVSNSTIREATASTYGYPVITLQSDLTANPAFVTVQAGDPVMMVNNSSQYVRIRSSKCTEFQIVGLQPGDSSYTWPFSPGGKTCDYFVWNWPNKVFQGQVAVK